MSNVSYRTRYEWSTYDVLHNGNPAGGSWSDRAWTSRSLVVVMPRLAPSPSYDVLHPALSVAEPLQRKQFQKVECPRLGCRLAAASPYSEAKHG